jgi:hypothetical protein
MGETISRRIKNKVKRMLNFEIDSWTYEHEIGAIVATTEACDLSQVVSKVVEKLPYDRANAYIVKDEEDCGDDDSQGIKVEAVSSE